GNPTSGPAKSIPHIFSLLYTDTSSNNCLFTDAACCLIAQISKFTFICNVSCTILTPASTAFSTSKRVIPCSICNNGAKRISIYLTLSSYVCYATSTIACLCLSAVCNTSNTSSKQFKYDAKLSRSSCTVRRSSFICTTCS